ncbi:UV radiation resistance associated protein-like protein [Leptotrombidium deliense]|uniref:UV radiation resistance associated protein-like protein n=1 Tax=Leptotrombidium deliense TaxID=299467 RepID=A0A443SFB5_9ACAR|nr:UV radiation resistance associated protein-like protein [Leptotrombidium deliense]
MTQRVMRDMRSRVNQMRCRLQENYDERHEKNQLLSEIDLLKLRVRLLKDEFMKSSKKLSFVKHEKRSYEHDFNERGAEMSDKFQKLKREKEYLLEKRKKLDEERERLFKTNVQLELRRKHLISEVVDIYHISSYENKMEQFSICDVHLPNSEDFTGHNTTMISVALGYVCHCLLLVSKFLDIPLRYSIIYLGSRSFVVDHINHNISDSQRIFPTCVKTSGKEKLHFDYGVYLVNRNIAQLRQCIGLTTTDLRKTLPNMFNLLCEKLVLKNNDKIVSDASLWSKVDSCLQRELEIMSKTQNIFSASMLSSSISIDKNLSVSLDGGLNEISDKKIDVQQQHRRQISSGYPIVNKATNVPVYNYSEPQLFRIQSSSNGHSSLPENTATEWVKKADYCDSVSSSESSPKNEHKLKNKLIIVPSPSSSQSNSS